MDINKIQGDLEYRNHLIDLKEANKALQKNMKIMLEFFPENEVRAYYKGIMMTDMDESMDEYVDLLIDRLVDEVINDKN